MESGWNVWVWLLGVVVRRHIDLLLLYLFFFAAASLLFVLFFLIIIKRQAILHVHGSEKLKNAIPDLPFLAIEDQKTSEICWLNLHFSQQKN